MRIKIKLIVFFLSFIIIPMVFVAALDFHMASNSLKELRIDLPEVLNVILTLQRLTYVLAAVTVLIGFIVAWSVAESISGPIHALHKGTEIIGSGDLDYKVGTDTKDEIGQLSRSFDQMTANLKIIRERLKRSEENYRRTLDNMLEGAQIIGFDWKYIYLNDAAEKHGQKPKEALLGRTMMEVYPGIDKTEMFARLKRCMEQRAPQRMENEFDYPGGEKGWFELSVQPAPEGIFILSQDITARKLEEERLKKYNKKLEEEVAERTALLKEAKIRAESADRAKSDFLANMSHELRTPLNTIIGFTEVLQDQLFGQLNEKQNAYVGNILESSRHLLNLINDILDLSKVEAGKLEFRPEKTALAPLLENSLVMLREKALKHNIKLSLQVAPEAEIGILADERKLKQIVFNLLSNAVKFTPDGGSVTIGARLNPGELEISVKDTGIGIKAEDMGKLFTEFTQLESPLTKDHEGTGLGLALTKRLVELHGGRVWAESAGAGKGAAFAFTLPIKEG